MGSRCTVQVAARDERSIALHDRAVPHLCYAPLGAQCNRAAVMRPAAPVATNVQQVDPVSPAADGLAAVGAHRHVTADDAATNRAELTVKLVPASLVVDDLVEHPRQEQRMHPAVLVRVEDETADRLAA